MCIGKRIKSRRVELHMTQTDLARKLGYKDKSSISKIEKGNTDISQSDVVRFAQALRTTEAYLMGWINDADEKNIRTSIKKTNPVIEEMKKIFAETMTEKEVFLIEAYRKASEKDKKLVETALELETFIQSFKSKTS